MNVLCACGCGEELPPSAGRPRRWVNDNHRKRGRPTPTATVPTGDGLLVRAVRRALEPADEVLDPVQRAQAEQALILASMVEERGPSSVPASRELRAVLDALAGRLDQDHEAFLKLVSTPTRSGSPGGWGGDELAARPSRTAQSGLLSGSDFPNEGGNRNE